MAGCSSTPEKPVKPEVVKLNPDWSQAKQFISLMDGINPKYMEDGKTPEESKVDFDGRYNSYHDGVGSHAADFLAGGLTGMVTLGTIQSGANDLYLHNAYTFLYPTIFTYYPTSIESNPNFYKQVPIIYNKTLLEVTGKTVNFDKSDVVRDGRAIMIYNQMFGKSCSTENKCILKSASYVRSLNVSYDSIPSAFKPSYKGNGSFYFSTSSYQIFVNEKQQENIELYVSFFKKYISNISKEVNNIDTVLYLPAKYNNGVPVLIKGNGEKVYFVKK